MQESSKVDNPLEICAVDISVIENLTLDDKIVSDDAKLQDVTQATTPVLNKTVDLLEKVKYRKPKRKCAKLKNVEADAVNKSQQQTITKATIETALSQQISTINQRLEKCKLEPITIDPGPNAKTISITHEETSSPRVIKLNQTFKFPSDYDVPFEEKHSPTKESFTQTSKTFVTKPLEQLSIPPVIPEKLDVSDNYLLSPVSEQNSLDFFPGQHKAEEHVFPSYVPFSTQVNNAAGESFHSKNLDIYGKALFTCQIN